MTPISLAGRTAIVTGASRGLGRAIAATLAEAGASVLACGRDEEALMSGVAEALAAAGLAVAGEVADVSHPEDSERLVRTALDHFGSLEILVNNAGIYGPIGRTEELVWDEWIRAIEINLFGSVLMARAVIPHFRAARYGKIVQLSGGGATAPLAQFSAYAASKAAVVRFAETLAEEVRDSRIDVNSIAPGPLNTRMLDEVLVAGPAAAGPAFYERALRQREEGGAPMATAAELAAYLCSSESDGISGRLISAIWDPWPSLALNRDSLAGSDVYTLRRILPEDRGLEWIKG